MSTTTGDSATDMMLLEIEQLMRDIIEHPLTPIVLRDELQKALDTRNSPQSEAMIETRNQGLE
jgi:hypothetical protein